MKSKIQPFLDNEDGATAIEYALIIALIAIVIVAGLKPIGGKLNNTFNTVSGNISAH